MYNKLRNTILLLSSMFNNPRKTNRSTVNNKIVEKFKGISIFRNILYLFSPQGHGTKTNFTGCYRHFRISKWQQIFTENGFSIIKIKPLLLYGPSEWPIIKVKTSKTNFCSSVLFLLKKKS